MNRADQAPEPSMEELLASIRSIISDADKKAPALGRVNSYARLPGGNSAPDQNAEGDEVLDLTDDLVLAGQAEPATVLSHGAEEPQEPEARQHSSFQKNIRRDG